MIFILYNDSFLVSSIAIAERGLEFARISLRYRHVVLYREVFERFIHESRVMRLLWQLGKVKSRAFTHRRLLVALNLGGHANNEIRLFLFIHRAFHCQHMAISYGPRIILPAILNWQRLS